MPSWLILALALALAGPSALTALRAPTILVWKTALLVGEFGHFLWLLSLLLAVLAWHLDAVGPVANFARWLTLPFCLGSGLLLLKPVLQARQVARKLPDRLRRAFGPVALDRAPFSLTGLRPASGPPVTVSTRVYTRPGTPDELSLDFYAAVRTDGRPAPCVVLIHGGGWFSGGRTELAGLDRWLARRGYAVAAIDYRLAPQHHWPDPADDVGAAITWLRGHADELGLDPQRFVLLGRSAGGQIATAFAYSRSDPVVRGVVSFYGPQDLRFFWKLSRRELCASISAARPTRRPRRSAPPPATCWPRRPPRPRCWFTAPSTSWCRPAKASGCRPASTSSVCPTPSSCCPGAGTPLITTSAARAASSRPTPWSGFSPQSQSENNPELEAATSPNWRRGRRAAFRPPLEGVR